MESDHEEVSADASGESENGLRLTLASPWTLIVMKPKPLVKSALRSYLGKRYTRLSEKAGWQAGVGDLLTSEARGAGCRVVHP